MRQRINIVIVLMAQFIALLAGGLTAWGANENDAVVLAPVLAANHCTRFAPPTAPDNQCGVQGYLDTGWQPWFETNSWALRYDIYALWDHSYN